MSTYELGFGFRYGGGVLWSVNELALKEYGYFIELHKLPLSKAVIDNANAMSKEFQTRLDWNAPNANAPIWERAQERDFKRRTRSLFVQMRNELGREYKVHYNNRLANVRGLRAALNETAIRADRNVLKDMMDMMEVVAPYFNGYRENTIYDDYLYRGSHIRVIVGRNGQVIDCYPLGNYTPNFNLEKLKKDAVAAEPYELDNPILIEREVSDPVAHVRRQATFARLTLEHHYGTKDMSKWV